MAGFLPIILIWLFFSYILMFHPKFAVSFFTYMKPATLQGGWRKLSKEQVIRRGKRLFFGGGFGIAFLMHQQATDFVILMQLMDWYTDFRIWLLDLFL